ncbi:MAG: M24 family metallopeptidase, partial [Candidatus Hodarchaeota archaeon]
MIITSLEKIKRIRSHEKFEGLDAIFITKPQNILYILGFKIESETFIMIPKEDLKVANGKIWVFLNALEYDQAKDIIGNDKEMTKIIEIKQIPAGRPKFVQKTVNKLKLNTVGFEDDFISVKRYEDWKKNFSLPNFVGASDIINHARLIKTEEEIERIKKAAELGDIGFKTIFDSVEEGKTEKELAAEAEYAMRKVGSEGTSFDTIVASGEKSAYPHSLTSEKKVQNGDLIIVDLGARYDGYCSDMTRSFIFGKKSQDKMDLINLVNDGNQFALDNVRAGIKCQELDKLTRDFFIEKRKDWGSRFLHSLGHG